MYRPNLYSTGWLNSYTPADQVAQVGMHWLEKLLAMAVKGLAAVAAWQERRKISLELGALDDRELADIGLVRSDIDRVASGQYKDDRLAA